MLTIVYARQSAVRRAYLQKKLTEAASAGRKALLFVPEQQVLEAEGFVSSLAGAAGIEVTSFRRIADSVFRRYGGLCYHYIGSGAKQVVMWRAVMSVREALRTYSSLSLDDMAVIRLLLSAVEEMKIYNILPDRLSEAADLTEDKRLSDKLSDVALIYAAYSAILHEKHDDASDDIARAAALLEGKDFFAGRAVFFDSFDGFTPQQELMLRRLLPAAEEATVSLAYEREDRRPLFEKLRETDRRLRRLAESLSLPVREERLAAGEGAGEIAFFASHIWKSFAPPFRPQSGGEAIRAVRCPGPYEEARFIAADIARRVRAGARYRDFAVIARNIDRYRGILDAALEGAGIPHFLSARREIASMPAVRMIFLALDIHVYHWRREDVIAYLRCGLSGLSLGECDLLEEYSGVWQIAGRRWYDEFGWQMNPRGLSFEFDEQSREELDRLNSLRERLIAPLTSFFEAFGADTTVRSAAEALVRFLLALDIPKKLEEKSREKTEEDDGEEADDYALLYNCLIDSLDQLVEAAGEVLIGPKEFSRLLAALLSEADVGRLPSRCDEVTVGNADLLRKSDTRQVYILGLSEGEFPASDPETGCFDREEKAALALLGIETSPDGERRFADERLYFYRAVTSARDGVTLTYSYRNREGGEQYPSSLLTDTLALFGGREAVDYDTLPAEDLLYGLTEILEYAVERGYDLPLLQKGFALSGKYALSQPLDAQGERLSETDTDSLFGKRMRLTQSRADRFVNCAFAYHCAYSLKLSEGASGSLERVDIGTLIHKILETFFSLSRDRLKELGDEEAGALLEHVLDDTLAPLRRGNVTKRFEALTSRLRRTARLLVFNLLEEFRNSDFVPAFFELPITESGREGVKAEVIPVSENLSVTLTGKIDRVDLFRRGKDVYLRVVDYKTSSKSFSLKDVALGLNLQMLIYLFSLSSSGNSSFREKIGAEGKILPAGVLYFSLGAKSAEAERRPADEDASRALMEKKILRSGVLLNDPDILDAMEKGMAGRFLPVTLTAEGEPKAGAGATLESLEELGALADRVRAAVTAIAKELKKGSAEAKPLKRPAQDPCEYCRMRPICRIPVREKSGREPVNEEGAEHA